MQGYTSHKIKQGNKAWEAISKLGFPLLANLKDMVHYGNIYYLPKKVTIAPQIFGLDIPLLKENTTR